MDANGGSYPRYDRQYEVGKGLWLRREDVNGSHVRLYLSDLRGRLHLMLINDERNEEHYILEESILVAQFGVDYAGLSLGNVDIYTDRYTRMDNLDHLNQWPEAFYPPGTRRKKQPLDLVPRQTDALRCLAELMPATQPDAWL